MDQEHFKLRFAPLMCVFITEGTDLQNHIYMYYFNLIQVLSLQELKSAITRGL